MHKYKKLISKELLAILVVGVIILTSAYFYISHKKQATQEEIEKNAASYSQTYSFTLKVPVAVNESEYTKDRIRGRVFDDIIEKSNSYPEAVALSKQHAEKLLKIGEKLWEEPVSDKQANFPMRIKWVFYINDDVNNAFSHEFDRLNNQNIEYSLDSIEEMSIEPTISSSIFYLIARVSVSSNEKIEIIDPYGSEGINFGISATTSQGLVDSGIKKETVTIKETPTGWLNVRSGPSTSDKILVKVYTKETYELLDEAQSWYKIKVNDEISGWVFSQYVNKN